MYPVFSTIRQKTVIWIVLISGYLGFHALYYRLVVEPGFSINASMLYGLIFVFGGWILYQKILPLATGLIIEKSNIKSKMPISGMILMTLAYGAISILWFLLYVRILHPDMQNELFPKQPAVETGLLEILNFGTMIFFVPIFEEYFYRRCLQSWIGKIHSSHTIGLVASTVLFLLPHPTIAWPVMAGLSFLAGISCLRYGLLSAILIHLIYNSFIVFHYLVL